MTQRTSFHPYTQLRGLLADCPEGKGRHLSAVSLSIGEPQSGPPAWALKKLEQPADLWGKYPPPLGTPALRTAFSKHLHLLYPCARPLDPLSETLVCAGSREGLYLSVQALIQEYRATTGEHQPVVLLPNPYYHAYRGAVELAGGRPYFVTASAQTNFQPDYTKVPSEVYKKTALAILCSPGNPQGSALSSEELKKQINCARRQNFTLLVDECYAELYQQAPVAGALEACADLKIQKQGEGKASLKDTFSDYENVLVFHSLSKRSHAAGLRVAFIGGDAQKITCIQEAFKFGGASVPLAHQQVAQALLEDQQHVSDIRQFYKDNFDCALSILNPALKAFRPAGGFFLWLFVQDGVQAAKKLWDEEGLRTLPGVFLGATQEECLSLPPDCHQEMLGKEISIDPAVLADHHQYLRVALVHPLEVLDPALHRLNALLTEML